MPEIRSTPMGNFIVPTGDYRHISKLRDGSQSAECWSRERREEWHENYDGPAANWGKVKEVVGANKKLPQRGKESVPPNAKNLRGKEGSKRVLRAGEQAGEGQVNERESQERVQKTKKFKEAAQKKVSR